MRTTYNANQVTKKYMVSVYHSYFDVFKFYNNKRKSYTRSLKMVEDWKYPFTEFKYTYF